MYNKYKITILLLCFCHNFCAPARNIYSNESYSSVKQNFRSLYSEKSYQYQNYYNMHSNRYNTNTRYDNELDRDKSDLIYNHDYNKSNQGSGVNKYKKSFSYKANNQVSSNNIKNNKNKALNEKDSYKVKKGDSLLKIAKLYKISLYELCKLNRIRKKDDIRVGMVLKIHKNLIKKDTAKIATLTNHINKPDFKWPLNYVINTRSDCQDGVNPIGIIITSKLSSQVYSSAAGTVKRIGSMRGYGKYIIVKHEDRFLTIYSNMKKIVVSEGEKIQVGKTLGILDGDKLHFQIDYSGKAEDPLQYLSKRS